jgi:hypothetical protein
MPFVSEAGVEVFLLCDRRRIEHSISQDQPTDHCHSVLMGLKLPALLCSFEGRLLCVDRPCHLEPWTMQKTTDPGTVVPSAICSARQMMSTSYIHNDRLLTTMIAEVHEVVYANIDVRSSSFT